MASAFSIQIDQSANASGAARAWDWGADSGVIMRVQCDEQHDKRRLSVLTIQLADKDWRIFDALPDPAFQDVPVRFYLAREASAQPVKVFDGKLSTMSAGYPSPQTLTLVAHDRSIDARRNAIARTFKGRTSTQVAETIAGFYGLSVAYDGGTSAKVGSIAPKPRAITYAHRASDWDTLANELDADGLECSVKGKVITIRQKASNVYYQTFARGGSLIVSAQVSIEHVSTPGGAGDVSVQAPFGTGATGKIAAAGGVTAAEQRKQNASRVSDRTPATGALLTTQGAAIEDVNAQNRNQLDMRRRRKDKLTLSCVPLPDFTVANIANLTGFGNKGNGLWYPETVSHVVAAGGQARSTTITASRGVSKGGAAAAGGGVVFQDSATLAAAG